MCLMACSAIEYDRIMGAGGNADVAAVATGRVDVWRLIAVDAQDGSASARGDGRAAPADLAQGIVHMWNTAAAR